MVSCTHPLHPLNAVLPIGISQMHSLVPNVLEGGARERVEVILHGQDVVLRLPCGEEESATLATLSKSAVLRQSISWAENDEKPFLALPKGCLRAWLQCVRALQAATSEQPGVAEHCQAWAAPRVVKCLQVRGFRIFLSCRRLHKQMRESGFVVIYYTHVDVNERVGQFGPSNLSYPKPNCNPRLTPSPAPAPAPTSTFKPAYTHV